MGAVRHRLLLSAVLCLATRSAFASCPSGTVSCSSGFCCPLADGGGVDVCCSNGCAINGLCCPSGEGLCSAGFCCPPGQGGRNDVCCETQFACTANGSCGSTTPGTTATPASPGTR